MIPDLNNLINAIECNNWDESKCEKCPYNYQYLDCSGDYPFWSCSEEKLRTDTLFFLKLYRYLIDKNKEE